MNAIKMLEKKTVLRRNWAIIRKSKNHFISIVSVTIIAYHLQFINFIEIEKEDEKLFIDE